jgi:hypothetical protein
MLLPHAGASRLRRGLQLNCEGAVEDIPFRLLIMVLLMAATISIAASGLTTVSEMSLQARLEEEMTELGGIALATSSSGSGTTIHHRFEIPRTGMVSVTQFEVGGAIGESGAFSTAYRITLSSGDSVFRTLAPGHHELRITNIDGDGPFVPTSMSGRIAVVLIAVDCLDEIIIVMREADGPVEFDIELFEYQNCGGD